ncbi:peptidoglycan-binding domain-containing protein [Thalassobaculum salexigens]|uniref:peptidoglycan-binding domain-containing protein n=1 Tax=Thalassobaculum salexigens TaxID=455360 RepID=UPI000426E4C9|nr:peptidoglycan-binding domain-containing protein [Thalassobaculum salexigens]
MPVSGSLIDVVVSLVLVYILTALICSAVREFFASAFQLRQKALARTIRDLCGENEDPCVTNNLAGRILDHPAIRKLRMPGRIGPSYLSARLFAGALLDELTVLAQASGTARPRVADLLAAAPNNDLRRSLGLFAQEAGMDRQAFRQRIEDWYDDAMDRATGWYRRRSRSWILIFAAAVAVALNIDTLEIARIVWTGTAAFGAGVPAAGSPQDAILTAGPGMPIGWIFAEESRPWTAGLAAVSVVASHPSKLLGFLITAVAVSLTADLWFSLLRRRGGLRATGALPERRMAGVHPAPYPAIQMSAVGLVPERAESDLEASGLTRDDIEDIQRALGMTGRFLTGHLDPATRSMIEEYQLSVGRRPTGVLTPYLVERLLNPSER